MSDSPTPALPTTPPGESRVTAGIHTAKVMMVDDEPITLDVVQAFLEEAGYSNFITLSDPTMAMTLVAGENPDVVLIDLMMPEVSGFDILREIRAHPKFLHLPVLVLTSSTDSETKLKALELGATDFLSKPVDASELVLRLRNTLAAKAYQDRLASYDNLTGLYNRQVFGDHIDWSLRIAQRQGRSGALMHVNVDDFKKINEALGPALGDRFLKAFAERLEQGVRTSDTIARVGGEDSEPRLSRLGGDEFAVLLSEVDRTEHVVTVAARLLQSMTTAFHVDAHEVYMTCSIGIAVFPDDGMSRDILVQRAGVAVKAAKALGGNHYSFYTKNLNDRSLQLLNLSNELHNAVQRQEFELFYQPKLDTLTSKLAGAEALVRWKHPERGYVSPGEFIPLVEENGLIVELGAWILNEACRQIAAWLAAGVTTPVVSVNISGRQFAHTAFLQTVQEILERHPFDRHYLQLELTESILMGDVDENTKTLSALHDMGVKLALDDFGTGFSSLSYLRYFPIDELKIDQSFVKDLTTDGKRNSRAIVIAIIAMARALGLDTVAEGVETQDQADFLKEQGCGQWQGYLFGRPMPAAELAALLPQG